MTPKMCPKLQKHIFKNAPKEGTKKNGQGLKDCSHCRQHTFAKKLSAPFNITPVASLLKKGVVLAEFWSKFGSGTIMNCFFNIKLIKKWFQGNTGVIFGMVGMLNTTLIDLDNF